MDLATLQAGAFVHLPLLLQCYRVVALFLLSVTRGARVNLIQSGTALLCQMIFANKQLLQNQHDVGATIIHTALPSELPVLFLDCTG